MSDPFARDVWGVMGMPLDNVSLAEAAALVERAVETRERLSFVTPNVNWLVRALKDPEAMQQIVNADLSVADGAPVVWLARQLGMPLKERVAGSDLFEHLRRDTRPDAKPIRVFFFGGRDGAAKAACEVLEKEAGRIVPAGWHNPGFGSVEDMTTPDIQAKINDAKPDFILVALGAAKGQAWIEANLEAVEAPVIAHLGAVVDFVAGTIKRAPSFVSKIGLEWVWRIIAEPSLWTRYWSDGKALLGLAGSRLSRLKKASRVVSDAPFEASHARSGETTKITLQGAVTLKNRPEIREAIMQAATASGTVVLDLTQATALDAAAIGQIRMLEKVTRKHGAMLQIERAENLKDIGKAAGLEPLILSQTNT